MHGKEDINARIRDVLKDTSRLAAALEELNIPNFEIDQLRELGICPVQVGFTEEDALAFEPCFFLPQLPSTLLSDYPIREEDSDNESLLEEERELNSGISDSDPDSDYYGPPCIQDYSFGNQRSVDSHLRATRDGFDDEDVLEDFQVLWGMCVLFLLRIHKHLANLSKKPKGTKAAFSGTLKSEMQGGESTKMHFIMSTRMVSLPLFMRGKETIQAFLEARCGPSWHC